MNILAIETSTANCSLALLSQDQLYTSDQLVPQQHGDCVFASIDQLLHQAHLTRASIQHVAYGKGPGSFTGVRIAAAVAQGLSLGLAAKVLGISSLAALAYQAHLELSVSRVAVLMDARMQEVYWGVYDFEDAVYITQDALSPPASLRLAEDVVLVGTALTEWGHLWPQHRQYPQLAYPRAGEVARLAQTGFAQGMVEDLAMPLYLRNHVADIPQVKV